MNKIVAFLKDESGASAAEYALILAIVGAGIAGAAFYLGDKIKTSMEATANCIADPKNVTASGCP